MAAQTHEYMVVEERLGSPQTSQDDLNMHARDGWRLVAISTIGPIPGRWLYMERPISVAT